MFRSSGLPTVSIAHLLFETRKLQFAFFANVTVPGLPTNRCPGTPQTTLNCLPVHLGNAPVHNLELSREAAGAIRVPHPGNRPDRAPTDFYLSGNPKEKLQSVMVTDLDSLISAITEFFSDAPQGELIAVHQNWKKRLRWAIKNGGQYYTNWHNKNPDWLNISKGVLTDTDLGSIKLSRQFQHGFLTPMDV